MKRLMWIVLVVLLVGSTSLFWLSKLTPSQSDKESISFNLCFNPELSLEKITPSPNNQNKYMQQYWVDSTGQFFLKTIVLQQKDTLVLSVFNQGNDKAIVQNLNDQLDTTLSQRRGQTSLLNYSLVFGKQQQDWIIRYLLQDPMQARNYFLIDLIQKDSSKAFQQFQDLDLNKILEKCR